MATAVTQVATSVRKLLATRCLQPHFNSIPVLKLRNAHKPKQEEESSKVQVG